MIVELKKGVWIADLFGHPGRTKKIESAKFFKNKRTANKAINEVLKKRSFKDPVIRLTSKELIAW